MRAVGQTIERVFSASEQRVFDRAGPGWPPLATSTRRRKREQGLDPAILRATDALYRSLTTPNDSEGIQTAAPDSFRLGTSVPYARFHDAGIGTPRRKLIDLSPADRKQITKALERYIADGTT